MAWIAVFSSIFNHLRHILVAALSHLVRDEGLSLAGVGGHSKKQVIVTLMSYGGRAGLLGLQAGATTSQGRPGGRVVGFLIYRGRLGYEALVPTRSRLVSSKLSAWR